MAEAGLALLVRQHREVEAWLAELMPLCRAATWSTWPHTSVGKRNRSDTAQEIREDQVMGLHVATPHERLQSTSPTRSATPLPSESVGPGDDAIPGQAWRDTAGHLADGKTHVGMDTSRLEAQMFDPGNGVRIDSVLGQGRETRAAMAEQFPHASMRLRGGVSSVLPEPQPSATQGLDEQELDHKRAATMRLCDLLTQHTLLEEAELYPLARRVVRGRGTAVAHAAAWVASGLSDHRDLLALVAELRRSDLSLPHADHLLAHLREVWTVHALDEEHRLFPALEALLAPDELAELGARLHRHCHGTAPSCPPPSSPASGVG